ncbi:DUF1345 domain-containing protein [Actinoplanes auranticolor]|uniref:DUF1345 domain-containing protein n=1 Tax=Actinoplanes auranticolor TaxID=47988 RepID=A0A919SNY6_9ACTN|nr:DUF1345 domain-containing protein [Actinoplanes auranticolor]GIM75892.1 hypothetical protein Aau02nite_68210 [Actinoplanes auranticolor]
MGFEEDLAARPFWRRLSRGEQRWPFALAIAAMITLQLMLPERYSLGAWWVLPAVEVAVVGALVAANPGRLERRTPMLRRLSLTLIAVASLGTAWSVVRLVADIAGGADTGSAAALLGSGASIWLINVLTFAVWYWELDRGGALERAAGTDPYPDFLFPQMTAPDMAPKDWRPQFADYLYLAFTNATAFSPTDTLPLSRWAKLTMLLQSAISLVTAALVVAKAVNALG